MSRGRISMVDIAVLGLLAALAVGTALLQNRHQPMALHDRDIRQTINAQISAFHTADNDLAFSFASPELKAQFGDAEIFVAMVRAHYRPVYTASRVSFTGKARAISDRPETRLQLVHLVDDRGTGHRARYMMQKQPDGSWKIAGCQLMPTEQLDI